MKCDIATWLSGGLSSHAVYLVSLSSSEAANQSNEVEVSASLPCFLQKSGKVIMLWIILITSCTHTHTHPPPGQGYFKKCFKSFWPFVQSHQWPLDLLHYDFKCWEV